MGYCMHMEQSTFSMPRANKGEAFRRMRALGQRDDLKSGGSYRNGKVISRHFAWMAADFADHVHTVEDIFDVLRFPATEDASQNLVINDFDGEKVGDENVFFNAISDLATGYIEMVGEDGYHWRWVFGGEKLEEQAGTITFG